MVVIRHNPTFVYRVLEATVAYVTLICTFYYYYYYYYLLTLDDVIRVLNRVNRHEVAANCADAGYL